MLYPRIENEAGQGPWNARAESRHGYLSAHDNTWQDGLGDPPSGWLHAWKTLNVMSHYAEYKTYQGLEDEGFHVVICSPASLCPYDILIGNRHQVVINDLTVRRLTYYRPVHFFNTFLK